MSAEEIYNHYRLALDYYDRSVKELRELNRVTGEQDWPDYYYFPFERWVKLMEKDFGQDPMSTREVMAFWFSSLVAWKQSKIVWPVEGAAWGAARDEAWDSTPITFLRDLPRWGVYVDFKDAKSEFYHPFFEKEPIGAFVTLAFLAKPVALVIFVRKGFTADDAEYMPFPMFLALEDNVTVGQKDIGVNIPGMATLLTKFKRVLAWYHANELGKVRGVVS